MSGLFFIAVRRLRAPLIFFVIVFAVSTAGLALLPGIDEHGMPWHPTLFEAFYIVTYTATTIGFGELPREFTDVQRLWVTFIIYLSVVAWAYLVGSLLALAQDQGFRTAIVAGRFNRAIKYLREPFYIICGLGETGYMVARALDGLGARFVVLDSDERRVLELDLGDFATDPHAFAGDATLPEVLIMAGLRKWTCMGVLVLTRDDPTNLAIAVAAKLLHPGIPVITCSQTPAITASMVTIDVDEVINPYAEFAERLSIAIRAPDTHRLLSWLTSPPGVYIAPRLPARPGHWIVCGYGRFGSEVVRAIETSGFSATIIDPKPAAEPGPRFVTGLGTDEAVLEQAGILAAEGIVAGTDNDTANLAIAIAARAMNPDIFVILRQNHVRNEALFDAFGADMTMVPSEIIANECLAILQTRHVSAFLATVRSRDNDWAAAITRRLLPVVGERSPEFWNCALTEAEAPGFLGAMRRCARPVVLGDLQRDITNPAFGLPCVPLLLSRTGQRLELPGNETELLEGDEVLFAGRSTAQRQMRQALRNANTADYVVTRRDAPSGALWRLLDRRRT